MRLPAPILRLPVPLPPAPILPRPLSVLRLLVLAPRARIEISARGLLGGSVAADGLLIPSRPRGLELRCATRL